MKKKIFITGVAGFIGFSLASELLKKGYKVYGIDNFDKYYSVIYKRLRIKNLKKSKNFIPLVSVPSTYSKVYEKDLIKNGFKIVIYANQLLRAAYPAMQRTAKIILKNNRALEADKKIIPIKEIINLIKND